MTFNLGPRALGASITTVEATHVECRAAAYFSRECGRFVCSRCHAHEGIVRCFCGWAASGGDGYRELIELGEHIEDD